ncbi:MAG TPA: LysE family translocator, partial [Gaiellaceae bacterium]|nr:LysE family translocator [Gaiellaceae bacterium]
SLGPGLPDTSTLLLFAGAALALIVVPGPAVLYIVAQSIDRGRMAGFVSALGVAVGGLVHVTAAAIGLSSLLVSSAAAFNAVKYAGAAYLIGLGLWTLLRRVDEPTVEIPKERRLSRRFWQGVVVNILNPKTALFFLAFLPQFVDPDKGSAVLQIGVLGLLFVTLAVASDSLWALGAGTASERLRDNRRFLAVQRYVSGSVFCGLGALTAVAKRH